MMEPSAESFRRDAQLTSRDVQDCFTLCLGRLPDQAALAKYVDGGIRGLLADLLLSDDFYAEVLTPLLLREPLPHERFARSPPLRLIDWVQRQLPVDPGVRRVAGAADSWIALLELVLSDPMVIALAPPLAEAGIDRVLGERRQLAPSAEITRAVIGAIDAASAVEVRGWALDLCDKATPVTLEFYADNLFLGAVDCTEPRADVREAAGGTGRCGFTFRIATARRGALAGGRALIAIDAVSRAQVGISTPVRADVTHALDVLASTRRELSELRTLIERIETRLPELSRLASVPLEAYGEYFERFYRLAPDVLARQRRCSLEFKIRPLISVVIPTFNPDAELLDQAIESVRAQTYDHWQLVITDDASSAIAAWRRLTARHGDPRIRCLESPERLGIAGNTNRGIAAATGNYVAFLDHDDELTPDALFEVVSALQEHRYGILYSDEDRIEGVAPERVLHHTPFFKPAFDLDLLRSMNYLCHLVVVRRDLVDAVGGLRLGFDGAQDHDLLLRVVEMLKPEDIRHVTRILYHWRVTPGSASGDPRAAGGLQARVVAVVQQHLDRTGTAATAEAHADPFGVPRAFATRIRWRLPASAPQVSLVIPTRDRLDLLRPCIDSVLRTAPTYPGALEIVVVDNDSVEPATCQFLAQLARTSSVARVVPYLGDFNWSAISNVGAHAARGQVVVFLNNDTVALSEDWCTELVAQALRPEVGAVGGRLLYEDGTLQHAGVVLGVEGAAGHDSVGESPERGGYFGRSHLLRSSAAVTGACLATRRDVFERLGGFDEVQLKVAFNDVDYCLRLQAAGYRVIYNPFAVLYHFESKSRGFDLSEPKAARHRAETAVLRSRWAAMLDADPLYNVHFEREARPFDRLRSPPSSVSW
jgi:GT2 family glycosyltransferase